SASRASRIDDIKLMVPWRWMWLPWLSVQFRLAIEHEHSKRGYVSLDILHTHYPEDSGEYLGVVRQQLRVVAEEGVVTDTQLPEQSIGAQHRPSGRERLSARSTRQDYDDRIPQSAPQFVRQIDSAVVAEKLQRTIRDRRVTPAADSNIQVEWYKMESR
uniref:DUF4912 domain-containing protein n=1 Tax=Macrostomum lignano TaxID=282301 RepID=A0A1I8FN15_9PLAT